MIGLVCHKSLLQCARHLIFSLFTSVSIALALIQAADTSGPSPDDPAAIYVEIIGSLLPRAHDNWTSQSMENDRYTTMSMSIKEAFEEMKLPREVKVVRFNSTIPEESPYLQISIAQWELDRMMPKMGNFECRLWAKSFLSGGETIDFGIVRGEVSVFHAAVRAGSRDYKLASDDAIGK